MPYKRYPYLFSPLAHLTSDDAQELAQLFEDQGVSSVFQLHADRRRNAWATTLPVGVFDNDFRPDVITQATHDAQRTAIYAQAREHAELRRRPHRPDFDAKRRDDGRTYYHLEALRFLRTQVARPAFLNALYLFLLHASANPGVIVPPKLRAPYVPRERRKEVFGLKGDMCRGPAWTPEEDAVLRRWFGMRTVGDFAGRHQTLTPVQWQRVLEVELGGRRTKQSVQNRFVVLNDKLAEEFLVHGFIPLDRLPAYMARAVGERPRKPPVRLAKRRAL